MMRLLFVLLAIASVAFSEQVSFFIQVPSTRNWILGTPVIVENDDGIARQMHSAGGNGWFSYSWEKNVAPGRINIYSGYDSLFAYPLLPNYEAGSDCLIYDLKKLFEAYGRDSLFFIPNDYCWFEEENKGFYADDIRAQSLCNGEYASGELMPDIHLYVLAPSYPEWVDDIPVIVDSRDARYKREMQRVDGGVPGKFYYSWSGEEWVSEEFFIYMKNDTLLEHPIGAGGIARNPHSGLFGSYIDTGTISLQECISHDLALVWPHLNPDNKPTCYFYIDPVALFYSIYTNEDSLVMPEHRLLDTTEIVYYNPQGKKLLIRGDSLDDGKYKIKGRLYDYDDYVDLKSDFTVENGNMLHPGPSSLQSNPLHMTIRVEGRNLLIANSQKESYAVFNSFGQIVSRGYVQGSSKIVLPAPGVYIVKEAGETHRIIVH